ncbi:MAG: endonuclease domain-containing protein [Anaerolineaceae bacterium]
MKNTNLITGQHVDPIILERAREMRHEMTPAESKLWARLRNNQLEGLHFRRQQVIGHYIVDFLCNPMNVVIEVDGDVHFTQTEYDRERDSCLRARGLLVLHFWNSDVNENMDEVLEKILLACRR